MKKNSFRLKKKGAPLGLSLNLDSSVIQDNMPVPIVSGLYMGSIHCSFNEVGMKNAGVTHIINTSGTPATYPNSFTYLSISIRDKDYSNLLSCIPACNIFIEAGLESGGSVLVHCTGGRSRSAAIITAFLMSSQQILFDEAFAVVKKSRSLASCNAGFEQQLRAYGDMNHDVHRAHQHLLRQHMEKFAEGRRNQEAAVRRLASTTLSNPLRIKLMQPDTAAVYIIPPLRGSDMQYVCRKCQNPLFVTSSIICHTPEDNQRQSGRAPRRSSSRGGIDGDGGRGSNDPSSKNEVGGNRKVGIGDDASTAAAVAAVEQNGAAVLAAALNRSNSPLPKLIPTLPVVEASSDNSGGSSSRRSSSSVSQHVLVSSPDTAASSGSVYAFQSKEDPSVVGPLFQSLSVSGDDDATNSMPAAPMTKRHGGTNGSGNGKGFDFEKEENYSSAIQVVDNSGGSGGGGGGGGGNRGRVQASSSGKRNIGNVNNNVLTMGGKEGLEVPRTPPQKWRDEDRQGWIKRMKVLECGITRSEKGRHRPSLVAETDEAAAIKVVNQNCKNYFFSFVLQC